MIKKVLSMSMFVALLALPTLTHAVTVVGTESAGGGFHGDLFAAFPGQGYTVASDGEATFDPYGAGYDTSDGISFSTNFTWNLVSGAGWVGLPNNTWVLPANLTGIGCGAENEPICEPKGLWTAPNATWISSVLGTYVILNSQGGVSDVINIFNQGNQAFASFQSDPVPEPGTLILLGSGLLALASRFRRVKA